MRTITRKTLTALSIASIAMIGLSACSTGASSAEAPTEPQAGTSEAPATENGAATDLVGSGCAAYGEAVPDGAGSIAGMSADPVAVAASNNPLLTTLAAAVSGQLNPDVNLVDTLNGDEFTVFAPVDEAFAKIDAATI